MVACNPEPAPNLENSFSAEVAHQETLESTIALGFDAIPPIYEPVMIPVAEVVHRLTDNELVMGVAWEGEAKAYPVTVLRFREMVNDELAGIPILVTWLPLCYTGLVHDRRINGETIVFGNASRLYKNAMTWWDHKTRSIWSQPVGQAIEGPLTETQLELLPFQLTTWANWKSTHPNTLVMVNDLDRYRIHRQGFQDDFVIGLAFDDHAKAYYYAAVQQAGIINDQLGEFSVLVWADENDYRAYLRAVGSEVLTFHLDDQKLIDEETLSTWDIRLGIAIEGPLQGEALQQVPSLTSFDWAWEDFYPDSELIGSE